MGAGKLVTGSEVCPSDTNLRIEPGELGLFYMIELNGMLRLLGIESCLVHDVRLSAVPVNCSRGAVSFSTFVQEKRQRNSEFPRHDEGVSSFHSLDAIEACVFPRRIEEDQS